MKVNRYAIIDADNPNIKEIKKIIVGHWENQRPSLVDSMFVIKLFKGDGKDHECLKGINMYNHKQILNELDNDKWREQTQLIDNRL